MEYAQIPKVINFKDLENNQSKSLSPTDYLKIRVNSNFEYLEKFISYSKKGDEVGSFNYMETSQLRFIRTKCFQKHSILLDMDETIGINPNSFKNFNLSKGDILIVKDSNVGEVCYIDEDLPFYSISGGVVKINLTDELDKFYILGIMKSSFFKEQIDLMTPKGATIKHSKDVYKHTKIPIPNDKSIIDKISMLTKSLIKKERELKNKFALINKIISEELENNQKPNPFVYKLPTYNDLVNNNRLDVGLYAETFKRNEFLITNYNKGYFYIDGKDLKSGSTPKENERIFNTGKINWITPTNISIYGSMDDMPKISILHNKHNIKKNCIVFINRTSKGKKGEYVGISYFYDYDKYGIAQHNQGLYRLDNLPNYQLQFLTSYFNSTIVRKMCSGMSMGSKMKEMKAKDFTNIPIPIFDDEKQIEISNLYSNHNDTYINHIINFNIEIFYDVDTEVNKVSGILDLDLQIKTIKKIINNYIKQMIV